MLVTKAQYEARVKGCLSIVRRLRAIADQDPAQTGRDDNPKAAKAALEGEVTAKLFEELGELIAAD
jgi:hypothetical protein